VVPIFTYRDERKLFAVIGAVIIAASIALVQLESLKTGKPSLIAVAVTAVAVFAQSAVTTVENVTRGLAGSIVDAPQLSAQNAALREKNRALRSENARLREAVAAAPGAQEIASAAARLGDGVVATVVGYDPENLSRTVTLDRGSAAGVKLDDGVIDDEGVVGRIVAVTPFDSTVLLVTDGASKVSAVVQRGRWWGIATGTNSAIRLEYVSQDAKLRVGDVVVTGSGRSFAAGFEIGRIARVDHPEGALYQTAVVTPAVAFGRLAHVVVVPR
jgi:rod shape-determining protein MreC